MFCEATLASEYGKLRGVDGSRPVPVENTGGPGTRDSHWREDVFRNELMTGFIGDSGNPMSGVTIGSLKDLGYQVDMSAAEPYSLPNLVELAEAGALRSMEDRLVEGIMLPNIPTVLPEDSLV